MLKFYRLRLTGRSFFGGVPPIANDRTCSALAMDSASASFTTSRGTPFRKGYVPRYVRGAFGVCIPDLRELRLSKPWRKLDQRRPMDRQRAVDPSAQKEPVAMMLSR